MGLAALRKWGTRIGREHDGDKLYYMRQVPPCLPSCVQRSTNGTRFRGWCLQRQHELLDSLRRNQGFAMRCARSAARSRARVCCKWYAVWEWLGTPSVHSRASFCVQNTCAHSR